MIKLSDRLQIIADRIEPSKTMADIGTDHGFLPIYLRETGKCTKVIMADISEPSLDKARTNAENCSDEIRAGIDLRAGDGLKVLDVGEVEAIAIAGMGGKLIRDIMADNMELTYSVNKFVLQPRIGQGYLRKWLCSNGFAITHEDLVVEGDYIPEIITVLSPKEGACSSSDNLFAGYEAEMMQHDEESMIWRVPPWIVKSSGPVEEFIERNIAREKGKLENVMRAKSRNIKFETQICEGIRYLENLLKECSDGN